MRIMLPGILLVLLLLILLSSCGPVREFHKVETYEGNMFPSLNTPRPDRQKKTVLIIADSQGTEIFDLLAPYNIFSMTHRFNVFIVGPEKKPIPLWKGVFVLPHLSFQEAEDIHADLLVVPAMLRYNDPVITSWIRKKKNSENYILSVCEGSRTVCETGLFDGKRITSHASSVKKQQRQYPHMDWIFGQRFVADGYFFSTSGVSSAVEGSLHMVELLLDKASMHAVKEAIHYPGNDILQKYSGRQSSPGDKLRILYKTMFRKNSDIAVYLHEGVDELLLGAVLDTYNRTFPRSIHTICRNDKYVRSRNGLLLFANCTQNNDKADELHVLSSISRLPEEDQLFVRKLQERTKGIELLCYYDKGYIFSELLERIREKYGRGFQQTVGHLLDYPSVYNLPLQN